MSSFLRCSSASRRRRSFSARTTRTQHGKPHERPLRLELLEDRRLLTITVSTLSDVVDGNFTPGNYSLREAIANAVSGETINFSVSGLIQLTNVGHDGQLLINKSLTIQGPGAGQLTIRGFSGEEVHGDGSRIFYLNDGNAASRSTVTISGLTLTDGDVAGHGGAIAAVEDLNILDSVITGNHAKLTGGGISHYQGTVTITRSTISGNSAQQGGGIFHNRGQMTITRSTISGNSAVDGGGMTSYGNATIVESTFSFNSATYGGGISHNPVGNLTIQRSTFNNNSASQGGAILTETTLGVSQTLIETSTISDNAATAVGGGLFNGGGTTIIRNSTIANNHLAPAATGGGVASRVNGSIVVIASSILSANESSDVRFIDGATNPFESQGFNVVGSGNGLAAFHQTGDQAGVSNPLLGPLASNGGPTQTRALLAGSPAMDAGDPNVPFNPVEFDQRGAPSARVSGPRSDVGAFEVQVQTHVVSTPTDVVDGDFSPGQLSLREAILLTNLNVGVDAISFAPSMSGATIALDPARGEFLLTEAVTIDARSLPQQVAIDAKGKSRIFNITAANGESTFAGLKLTGGRTEFGTFRGGGISSQGAVTFINSTISGNSTGGGSSGGGAVFSQGPMTFIDSTVSGNSTEGPASYGGAVFSQGPLTFINSTISGNSTGGIVGRGGAIDARSNLTLIGSTVSGNSTTGYGSKGGGIFAASTVTLTSSTVSGNSTTGKGAYGGGIAAMDVLTLTSSTISGNRTTGDFGYGGGIWSGSLGGTIANSTVTDNHSARDSGGGVWTFGTFVMRDSIVSGNSAAFGAGSDIYSKAPWLVANNIIGWANFAVPGNIFSTDPKLGPLQDNGGPTLTRAPLPGSPAINAGDPNAVAGVNGVPLYDQRGAPFARVAGGRIDIGAVESQPMSAAQFGDYNLDGAVDAADYVVWRNTRGNTVPAFSGADGSGNGLVDQPDYDVWRSHFGMTVPAPAPVVAAAMQNESAASSSASDAWFGLFAAEVGSRSAASAISTGSAAMPTYPSGNVDLLLVLDAVSIDENTNPLDTDALDAAFSAEDDEADLSDSPANPLASL